MNAQERLSAVIDRLKDGTGDHQTIVGELEGIWGVMDHGYTGQQVAALVEEMVSKGYDQMKARTLTTIEVALGQSNLRDKPIGRQITYALDDAKRVMMDVLARVAPEITPEMLEEAGRTRKDAEREANRAGSIWMAEQRIRSLRQSLNCAEMDLDQLKADAAREQLHGAISEANAETLQKMMAAFRAGVASGQLT